MLVIQTEGEARTALKSTRTIRCLRKTKYTPESRRPKDGKAWGDDLADRACRAIMRDLGRDETAFTKQLLMVQLRHRYAYFSFDVFLQDGDEEPSTDICQRLDQPIFQIKKKKGVKGEKRPFELQLSKVVAQHFALHYSHAQKDNKGGPPYFEDWTRMQIYVDGVMMENPEDFKTCTDSEMEEEEKLRNEVGDGNEVVKGNPKEVDGVAEPGSAAITPVQHNE
ncbi:hypothetical protein F5B18DRAFT_643484 [Nemania serpens]|nr:hypothetical protein F5B18DRAFT_643484 [Nemania serpens]